MEKERKTKTEGYLPPKYLMALKRYTAIELEARESLCKKIECEYNDFFRKKDLKMQQILTKTDVILSGKIPKDIQKLYRILVFIHIFDHNYIH